MPVLTFLNSSQNAFIVNNTPFLHAVPRVLQVTFTLFNMVLNKEGFSDTLLAGLGLAIDSYIYGICKNKR